MKTKNDMKNIIQGQKDIELSKRTKMEGVHFQHWLKLFEKSLREHFEGPMVEHVLQRARSIAGIMEHKVDATRQRS